ncbi:Beta-glucan synthesis-associated protein KRE6 [Rhizoctonia solani]|uniref:Beta-glucan synthesis-associated protein KRE6 n=1 Tax=Rhizoctonia solani TaxID=456999 RepID=A0A0K6FU02_9AGAM|nr:Beta-glucan synthesis-associated protein KRE6 [Rhizoctonia solani]
MQRRQPNLPPAGPQISSMNAPPPRPDRFKAQGLPGGPRPTGIPQTAPRPIANQAQRQMYLAGANVSATGSAAQLLQPGSRADTPDNNIRAALAAAPVGYVDTGSHTSLGDTPYPQHPYVPSSNGHDTLSEKYQIGDNPFAYGYGYSEADDELHTPDPKRDKQADKGGSFFTSRGAVNLGCLVFLIVGLVVLFAGYPLITYFTQRPFSTLGGYNLGGINATGQVPVMSGNFGLIDLDTPSEAYTRVSIDDGSEWDLVFSDEFNTDGRSFYPGDDPFWEAVDLHYWGTNNLEWYDPEAVTTGGGYLNITMRKMRTHDLNYQGGLISSWNKFCFTGGYIEANVSLPGKSTVYGLWPALWTMGNLGRAGYGASLDGMWPYSYDSCDIGTLANQTDPKTNGPAAVHTMGDPSNGNELSYLPGQRLSACTCPNDPTHPGPKRKDGSFVGRSAPEIDIFEAQVDSGTLIGHVSQSGQWAPFNHLYSWFNNSENLKIYDSSVTQLNSYVGGVFQQSTSAVSVTDQKCYTQGGGCFSIYGFEYEPGNDGYITWVNDNKPAWTIRGAGMAADPVVEIGARPIPQEPMYIIVNLGISPNFGAIDFEHLQFPTWMLVDWIRVYQPKGKRNVGCDPEDFPTSSYINKYIEAYTNPNLTTWVDDFKQSIPPNRLIDTCT